MKRNLEAFTRIALFLLILYLWLWVLDQRISGVVNMSIIVGGVILSFPVIWFGRKMLDRKPTVSRLKWTTIFVHYAVLTLIGMSIWRAVVTHQDWSGWILPVPGFVGLILVIVTGTATLLAVVNLALKGLGAPFAIALSKRLAVDWLYSRSRNPMVLATIGLFFSLGIWYQSLLFLLYVLFLIAPALLFVVKIFEERELELRFGASYLEYKSRTPMLFPRIRKN